MNPVLKNILAFIVGWILGSIVNMLLINAGHALMPIEGLDPQDMESMKEIMPTADAKYFLFPFLAHALGTLVGAFLAAKIAASHKMKLALVVGGFFFLGGIAVNYMIPGPTWFAVVDILLAYIPMAWIGGKLAGDK